MRFSRFPSVTRSDSIRSSVQQATNSPAVAAGYILVSLGIMLATSGGSWDISNHLLNKPETFFSLPHAVLYSGVVIALAGAAIAYNFSRKTEAKGEPYLKFVILGMGTLVGAGPVDLAWHSAFGLDGLLSPPHLALVSGMILSSIGAASAILRKLPKQTLLIPVAIVPVWLATSGLLYMLSLPFSRTSFFDFNPNPSFAAGLTSLAFPFLVATIICLSSMLAGRKFGIASVTGSCFVAISVLTSILPNAALAPAIPFYLLNLVPIVSADAMLSVFRSKGATLAVGAVAGLVFITLYFPLLTHTYNKAIAPDRLVWSSQTGIIYFSLLPYVFELIAIPAAFAGIAGAIFSSRLVKVLRHSTRAIISNNSP